MEASEDVRKQALESLKHKQQFRTQLVTYVAVNALLWGIWLVIGLADEFTFPWPIFPTAGWGLGLALQAWNMYGQRSITEQDVQSEMQRIQSGR